MHLIADAIPQIVWIADPLGDWEFCNQAWRAFTGLAHEQSIERGWETVVHPEDLPAWRTGWLTSLRTGIAFEAECRLRRTSGGTYRWHLNRAHAFRNDDGIVIKWIGSSTDIDEQKVAQQALHEAVENVEQQVRERTAELLTSNMQLLDAISERRRAAAMQEQDTQRLNEIIATQALLVQQGLDLPSFLKLATEKIHRLTGATGTIVEIIEGTEVVSAAATGSTVPFIGFRMSMAGSLSGLCIRKRKILKCENAGDDPRVDLDACLKVGAVSLVVAPLYNKGAPIGVLKILSDVPAAFDQRDVQTLELMAGLLGAAVAQQVHMESNERLLAERTTALAALQTEIENRLDSEQQLREAEQRTRLLLERSHDAAEARLAGKEKILRSIADTLPAWIAYIDAEERYRFANAYYRTQGGLDPDQMIGLSLSDVVGEMRYAGMKDGVNDALRGTEARYERVVNTKNGAVRQQVRYFPDMAEDGAVAGFYSIVTKAGESEESDLGS